MRNLVNNVGWLLIQFFYAIGFFGEVIQFLLVSFLVYRFNGLFYAYILGFILNKIINGFLKRWLRQPRPANQKKFLESEIIKPENYGMPSGHTQCVFYSLMFLYLSRRKIDSTFLLAVLISLITFYQRLAFNKHTITQLLAGVGIGSFVALSVHSFFPKLISS